MKNLQKHLSQVAMNLAHMESIARSQLIQNEKTTATEIKKIRFKTVTFNTLIKINLEFLEIHF